MVADDPDNKIKLKVFHNAIVNDHGSLKEEEAGYKELPAIRKADNDMIMANYFSIKKDIQLIINRQLQAMAAIND
jgi:hypothetical protein